MIRAAAIAVALLPATAGADVSAADAKQATALFEQGRLLVEAGQLAQGCAKFEASQALDPQIGTRLNLADCFERQGRLLDAWELYATAATEAARTGKGGREAFAREKLAVLRGKLVRITLRIADPDRSGLAIQIGGRYVDPARWTLPQVAMPGPIVIVAEAPGATAVTISRSAAAGGELVVEVPALGGGGEPTVPPPPSTPPNGRRSAYLVGGAGGVLVIGSLALSLHAKSRYDAAAVLDRDGVASAQREADVGTVLAITGVAAIAVGVYLYVRARPPSGVAVVPTADGGSTGLAISGQF